MFLYLPYIVLILNIHHHIIVSATTSIDFFTDDTCHDGFATVQTHTDAGNGTCGIINGTNSANLTTLDPGCTVTVYSDLYCTYNKTPVRLNPCASQSINSYSVDCPALNGTDEDSYTTIWSSSSKTSSQVPPSSIFIPLTSSSQQGSFTQPTTLPSFASPSSSQAGTSIPTDPRTTLSTAAPTPQTATSWSTKLYSTLSIPGSSTTTSSLPTDLSQQGGNNGSHKKIEIILPIAVVMGILLPIGLFRKQILEIVIVVMKKKSHNLAARTGNTISGVSPSDLSQAEQPDAKSRDPAHTTNFWGNLERQLSESDLVQLSNGFSSSRYRLPNLRDRMRSRTSEGL